MNLTISDMNARQLLLLEVLWIVLVQLTGMLPLFEPVKALLMFTGIGAAILTPIFWIYSHSQRRVPAPVITQPAVEETVPELPLVSHPVYMERLNSIEEIAKKMKWRQSNIQEFIASCFAGSNITIERYDAIISNSISVLETNAKRARQAVKMFGSDTKPTPERTAILDAYYQDSADIENRLNRIIDELLRMQQKTAMDNSDKLDALLVSLADTTKAYNQSLSKGTIFK